MERQRYLTVPVNEKGKHEYEHGLEHTNNMIEYALDHEEYLGLADTFAAISKRCGLLIDDYESEILYPDQLKQCMDLIFQISGCFSKAAHKAIEYDTFLALDF